jgi:penicillin-binding protein 2
VLAFVSAPSFDPNIFVDGVDQQTWDDLNNSPDKPLLNRPLRGTYPPGSTYKPFMALAALTLHKRTPEWGFQDTGSYTFAGHVFHNDVRNGQGWIDMNRAITVSNDTYFYMLAHDLGVNAIAGFMKPLGLGQITGIDIDGEAKGILPSTEWKKHAYKRPEMQRWYEGETISLGIGQGYNSFTMLQLAHATSTLANDGVIMTPHLVQEIENPITKDTRLTVPKDDGRINVPQADIDIVKRAMVGVVTSGTAAKVFIGAPYQAAGKTGTAQVYSLQGANYKGHAIPENLRDHALFIAFAPADNPKIALALIVENGGWGAEVAGPIARHVLDYYLIDRQKPGAEAAAVAAAASATADASAPVIGAAPTSVEIVQPASVAAGFTPLPIPGAASNAAGASAPSAASAASDVAPAAPGGPVVATPTDKERAKPVAATAADASAPFVATKMLDDPASAPAKTPVPRKSGPRHPRPASDPAPSAAAPSRDDSIQPTSPRQPVAGGIDE